MSTLRAWWRRHRAIRRSSRWEYEMFCWGTVNKWWDAKEETDRLKATRVAEWRHPVPVPEPSEGGRIS